MSDDDKKDFLHLGPDLGDGHHPYIRHREDCAIETGIAKTCKEGEPVNLCDGVLRLTPRGPGPLYNVDQVYERTRTDEASSERSGPAMVSNKAFRAGWDNIFGSKTVGQA